MNNPASLSAGFVKVIAEEQGITNLNESCTSFIADDVTFKCILALYVMFDMCIVADAFTPLCFYIASDKINALLQTTTSSS